MISFCTQVCNRLWQLSKTLLPNLEVLRGTEHQLVIVVYQISTDGVVEFVKNVLHPNLKIHFTNDDYDIIKAKNLAHSLADGDYLFNLDADNFISPATINMILNNQNSTIHNWSGLFQDGSYGRIGTTKDKFISVGGYPSYMSLAAVHDEVLLQNLAALSKVVNFKLNDYGPIANTKNDTTANFEFKKDWDMLRKDNLDRHWREPIFIPQLTVTLKKNKVGAQGGHIVTLNRGLIQEQPDSTIPCVMRYSVKFDDNFDFSLGGKLPGFASGTAPTNGEHSLNGWSVRPMWRIDGQAEFYIYHPRQKGKYGDSIVMPLKFIKGKDHVINLTYHNNKLSMEIDNFKHVINLKSYPSKVLYHIFRGGKTINWASTTDGVVSISPYSLDATKTTLL